MATAAQVQQFVNQWAAAAAQASDQLGIPTAYILGQWGMESAWGTQPNMGKNNPGNVGNLGNGKWQDYASQSDFVKAYVASMRSDFPALKNGAVAVSGNPTKDIPSVFGGNQKYDPGNSSYWKDVMGGVQALLSNTGKTVQQIQELGFQASPGGSPEQSTTLLGTNDPVTQGVTNAVSNAFSWVPDLVTGALTVVVALALGIVGVFILVKDEVPTPKQIVKEGVTGND